MKLMSMMPLSTAMPLSAMKPTAAEMVKGIPRSQQREDAAGDGERHAEEDERGLPQRAEAEEDQHEDERQRERHDDGEALLALRRGF